MRAYTLPGRTGAPKPTCAICRLQHIELLDAATSGPMLKHGIQEMDQTAIALPVRPADHPSKDALERQFRSFRAEVG